jgi:hypothetical protein
VQIKLAQGFDVNNGFACKPAPAKRAGLDPAGPTFLGACVGLGPALGRSPDRVLRAALQQSGRTLSKLLPILSDTLTECVTVELIVVDTGGSDGTDSLMQAWTEIPGFRYLALDDSGTLAEAFEAGIWPRAATRSSCSTRPFGIRRS